MEYLYIGNYSNNGIYVYKFNDGKIEKIGQSSSVLNPAFLHICGNNIFAALENEKCLGKYGGGVASFQINGDKLKLLETKAIEESGPGYVVTDEKEKKLFIANYGEGSICVYKLNQDGSIGETIYRQRYENSHMHFIGLSKKEEYIYTVDLGRDEIRIYKNEENNIFEYSVVKVKEGSGARHFVLSEDKEYMYLVTEHTNMIYVYKIIDNTKLDLIQEISTLPEDNIEKELISYAGAIKISKDSKYLYVTNRGHDSISVFKIREHKLELIQNISSGGKFPRDITFNINENYMFVANQNSNNINIFKRDVSNGKLKIFENILSIEKPACIVIK